MPNLTERFFLSEIGNPVPSILILMPPLVVDFFVLKSEIVIGVSLGVKADSVNLPYPYSVNRTLGVWSPASISGKLQVRVLPDTITLGHLDPP